MKIYRNHIGGTWMESLARRHVPNNNPADTRDIVGEVPLSTADEATAAVEVAAHAFLAWRRVPAPERGAIIARVALLLAARADHVARALTREQGKILAEARAEVQRAVRYAEQCAAMATSSSGVTVPHRTVECLGYTTRRPAGVVALLASWAMPVAQPLLHLAAALAAGNTVVLKPDLRTPETAEMLVQCFVDAGAPSGVVNLVHGADDEVAATLIDHPVVRVVTFSGARAGAVAVQRRAAARGVRVLCESDSANPVVVLEDADLDRALAAVLAGAYGNAGQSITATKRVVLLHPVADAFLEALVARAGALRLGSGLDEGVTMGPCIDEAQLQQALASVRNAQEKGAELLCGGTRVVDGPLANGFFLRPTVLDRVQPEMRVVHTPAPGPVLAVTRVESFAEVVALVNQPPGSIVAGVHTRDGARMFCSIDAIDAVAVAVNAPTTIDDLASPPVEFLLDFFSATRTISIDYGESRF